MLNYSNEQRYTYEKMFANFLWMGAAAAATSMATTSCANKEFELNAFQAVRSIKLE